jgi:transposase-like protein
MVNTHGRQYPAAIGCFQDDLDAVLAIHRVPTRHGIRVRTSNLERSFVEERRRTKVIPRFTDDRAAMKLVFAAEAGHCRRPAPASVRSGRRTRRCCPSNCRLSGRMSHHR